MKKEQLSNYECNVDFVRLAEKDWKLSICARQYLKFPALYDVATSAALVSENDIGLIVQFVLAGVGKDISLQLIQKFLSHIAWQK